MCKYLVSIGFRQSKTDQYLFVKQNKKDSVILLIYINNSIIIETRENIDKIIIEIKTVFIIEIKNGLNNFLEYSILRNKNQNECWIFQNYLVFKLIIIFGKILKK